MIAIAFFAVSLGDKSEKKAAIVFMLAWLSSIILQSSGDISRVQWGMAIIDIIVLAVFVALVWKAPRSWPVWACAFQLLTVTSHFMIILNLKPPISAFYTVVNMTSYGIMAAIAVGAFWSWQERKAVGLDEYASEEDGFLR